MTDCSVCKGRGGCPSCQGAGTYAGRRCRICLGSGACPLCKRALDPSAPAPVVDETPRPARVQAPAPAELESPSPSESSGPRQVPSPGERGGTQHMPSAASVSAAYAPVATPSADYAPRFKRWSSFHVAWRALLAVVLLVLFYAFAIGMIGVLLFVTWLQLQLFRSGGPTIGWLVIVPPLGALAIALSIWPRFHGWVDPGRGLTEQRAPELYAMLREVARVTHQPMPRRLYLFDEVNAFVANRGMFLGRAMGIGLPLFELLTVAELRAVVAHEFGHYASRAGGLSTFVYRAVRTFGTATEAAGLVPGLDIVFGLWAELFLRVAMPISRQQELRADELAVRVSGAEATISALTKISRSNPHGEIEDPVAGWEQNLHETHPPLRDRIALARSFNIDAALAPDERPARVLLETLIATSRPAAEQQSASA